MYSFVINPFLYSSVHFYTLYGDPFVIAYRIGPQCVASRVQSEMSDNIFLFSFRHARHSWTRHWTMNMCVKLYALRQFNLPKPSSRNPFGRRHANTSRNDSLGLNFECVQNCAAKEVLCVGVPDMNLFNMFITAKNLYNYINPCF